MLFVIGNVTTPNEEVRQHPVARHSLRLGEPGAGKRSHRRRVKLGVSEWVKSYKDCGNLHIRVGPQSSPSYVMFKLRLHTARINFARAGESCNSGTLPSDGIYMTHRAAASPFHQSGAVELQDLVPNNSNGDQDMPIRRNQDILRDISSEQIQGEALAQNRWCPAYPGTSRLLASPPIVRDRTCPFLIADSVFILHVTGWKKKSLKLGVSFFLFGLINEGEQSLRPVYGLK